MRTFSSIMKMNLKGIISLIKLNNYDMALSDILGSNLFNLLVLAIGDLILRKNQIYYYADFSNLLILKFPSHATADQPRVFLHTPMMAKSILFAEFFLDTPLHQVFPSFLIIRLFLR